VLRGLIAERLISIQRAGNSTASIRAIERQACEQYRQPPDARAIHLRLQVAQVRSTRGGFITASLARAAAESA